MAAPAERTNDRGEFRVYGLAAGDYYTTTESSSAQPVAITPGATIDGLEIGLLRLPSGLI